MERLREKRVAPRREGGVHDPTVLADQAGIRAAIDAQMCPFCERGPFKMLPVHTNKIHGIDKWELREMAGYTTTDPICSEEARLNMAAKAHPESLDRARAAQVERRRRKPRRTTAGQDRTRSNLRTWAEENPDEARAQALAANARAVSPEVLARRSGTIRARAATDPEFKARLLKGLDAPGVRPRAVAAAAAANRKPPPPHGTVNRAKHHKCKCDLCRAARAEDRRKKGQS